MLTKKEVYSLGIFDFLKKKTMPDPPPMPEELDKANNGENSINTINREGNMQSSQPETAESFLNKEHSFPKIEELPEISQENNTGNSLLHSLGMEQEKEDASFNKSLSDEPLPAFPSPPDFLAEHTDSKSSTQQYVPNGSQKIELPDFEEHEKSEIMGIENHEAEKKEPQKPEEKETAGYTEKSSTEEKEEESQEIANKEAKREKDFITLREFRAALDTAYSTKEDSFLLDDITFKIKDLQLKLEKKEDLAKETIAKFAEGLIKLDKSIFSY